MVYQRPTVETMQKWADEVGDQSWTWPYVLEYFNRSATLTTPPTGSRPANATPGYQLDVFGDGHLQVSYPSYVSAFASWFFDAANQLGLPVRNKGFDGGQLIGHSYCPLIVSPGTKERSSSQTSYLPLCVGTERLTIYTHSLGKDIFSTEPLHPGLLWRQMACSIISQPTRRSQFLPARSKAHRYAIEYLYQSRHITNAVFA